MSEQQWAEANQRYLMAALGVVRRAIARHASPDDAVEDAGGELEDALAAMPAPATLDLLCARFGLSPFERDLLLLCAGIELDSGFAALCARAQGDPARTYPTFSLALASLPGAHWSALTPSSPLRRWRMIEVGSGSVLTLSPLRIDERILHYLAGVQHMDERLAGLVEHLHETIELASSHRRLAEVIATTWHAANGPLPAVQLCGDESADGQAIAAVACAALGLRIGVLSVQSLPTAPAELDGFIRLWGREAALTGIALLLECHEPDGNDPARVAAVSKLLDSLTCPVIVNNTGRRSAWQRSLLTLDVRKPAPREQLQIWQQTLSTVPVSLNGESDALVAQFNLAVPKIYAARVEALAHHPLSAEAQENDAAAFGRALWDACRVQARPRLDDLAQRIDAAVEWDSLVLPEPQLQILREVAVHVRQRTTVYERWGFAAKGARGLGISALFSGVSGTGKTMAAEVLANELRLDLYRIDLSAVVSKYIGETEKNLRRVFDAAEEGGAILLFDEADALFGKRSEVKDSHDRYANIEVSYLLQRMEAYRGLAILTTNLKGALDSAFIRRIRFVVQFPFPDPAQRAEIWRRIFPAETPVGSLDVEKLARLNVSGGNIRNIALNAAFLAANDGEAVRMSHLLSAAQREYAKLEKSLTDAETRGWA